MGKTDQGVVTLWMARHYWKRQLKYIGYGGTGKQVRDILHIDDAVDLIAHQIHNPNLFQNKILNAGGGIQGSVSLMEMTELCREITGNIVEVESEPANRPADLRSYISDTTRMKNDIGWSPKKDIKCILSDVFQWINTNEKLLRGILA
jgi:CDP-paratose 2-epimerase